MTFLVRKYYRCVFKDINVVPQRNSNIVPSSLHVNHDGLYLFLYKDHDRNVLESFAIVLFVEAIIKINVYTLVDVVEDGLCTAMPKYM